MPLYGTARNALRSLAFWVGFILHDSAGVYYVKRMSLPSGNWIQLIMYKVIVASFCRLTMSGLWFNSGLSILALQP